MSRRQRQMCISVSLKAWEHCRFCSAKASCREYAGYTHEQAARDFMPSDADKRP